jgi:hypothetical protein
MDAAAVPRADPAPPDRSANRLRGAAANTSAFDLLQDLVREVPGLISDRVELFSLEVGRAASALARIVALTVAVAILGITAWTALWAGVVMGLLALGWHWSLALGVVVLANAGALAWALMQMRRLSRRLALPATRRHLTLSASTRAVAANTVPVSAADPSLAASEDAHASPGADGRPSTP